MGFRFRKTIKLFPGVKINLSKSGISTTIGGRGASVNIGRSGTRATVGLPGTGISYSMKLSDVHRPDQAPPLSAAPPLKDLSTASRDACNLPGATSAQTSVGSPSWAIAFVIAAVAIMALVTYELVAR